MPYAICRISDQKLLPRPIKKVMRKVTWAEFEDDVLLPSQYVPFTWPTRKGAESAMKMWKKGGWVVSGQNRGGIKLLDKDHARTEPVAVVAIGWTIVDELPPDPNHHNPNSVLD